MSYVDALTKARCDECIEATGRKRRRYFAAVFAARIGDIWDIGLMDKIALLGELDELDSGVK